MRKAIRNAITEKKEGEELSEQLISKVMRELGRKGGKRGGARRREMPAAERTRLAANAARSRWGKELIPPGG